VIRRQVHWYAFFGRHAADPLGATSPCGACPRSAERRKLGSALRLTKEGGGVVKRSVSAVMLVLALGSAACAGGNGGTAEPATENGSSPAPDSSAAAKGVTYVSLGDSWPEGAHCNGCRTFPQTHAAALAKALGKPVELVDLAGQAQPYFDTPGGGGSAGLLKAIRTDASFREKVATGDVIVIATGPNDGGDMFERITAGTCGKDNTACVAPLARTWKREFDQILDEVEALRQGQPTAIRLVNAANAFNDPSSSAATLRGFEAYFDALTNALCDNAEAHDVICVDVRPVLNGPGFEQPVDDSSQDSMDAVAELLTKTGVPELE
jgi:hypothetical protein